MLTYSEFDDITSDMNNLESMFSDESIIDKAEYYDIEEDPVTLLITVTIYDENGAAIASTKVEDEDVAIAYLEEMFDLEVNDPDDADDTAAASASPWGHNAKGGGV